MLRFPRSAYEPGALKRAEWMKAMAVFYNMEYEAMESFDRIKASYEAIARQPGTNAKKMLWLQPGFGYGKGANYTAFSYASFKADYAKVLHCAGQTVMMLNGTRLCACMTIHRGSYASFTQLLTSISLQSTFSKPLKHVIVFIMYSLCHPASQILNSIDEFRFHELHGINLIYCTKSQFA